MSETVTIPKEFYQLRPWRWLLDMLLDWGVIVASFWLYSRVGHWYLAPLFGLVIGARAHALGLLAHDGTHRLAVKTPWINDFLTNVFTAWPLFVAIDKGYRPWHFQHHRLLGTCDDPELADYRDFEPYKGKVTWRKITGWFFLDLLGLGIGGLFKFMKAVFPSGNISSLIGPACWWGVLFGAAFFTDSMWIFYLWAWSIVSGFWAVFRIRTWTEHVGLEPAGKATSHRFSSGLLARFLFFPHNTFCHYEHHRWPRVPYYHLPAVRALDDSRPVLRLPELFPAA